MAYNSKIKEDAYLLWTGLRNDEKTIDELVKAYPQECAKLTRNTVMVWRKKYKWRTRARAIDRKVATEVDKKIVGRRIEMLADLDAIYDTIIEQLEGGQVKFKSAEGAVNALYTVSKRIDELTGEREISKQKIKTIVGIFFQILVQDKDFGEKILSKEAFIMQRIETELEKV